MNEIQTKVPETVRWDCVSLGEVMLRLDPSTGTASTPHERFEPGRVAVNTTSPVGFAVVLAFAPLLQLL